MMNDYNLKTKIFRVILMQISVVSNPQNHIKEHDDRAHTQN